MHTYGIYAQTTQVYTLTWCMQYTHIHKYYTLIHTHTAYIQTTQVCVHTLSHGVCHIHTHIYTDYIVYYTHFHAVYVAHIHTHTRL